MWTGITGGKEPLLKVCALGAGDYTVVEETTWDSRYTFAVTANILDGNYLSNPSRTVVVRMGTSDRTLIFGNKYTGP